MLAIPQMERPAREQPMDACIARQSIPDGCTNLRVWCECHSATCWSSCLIILRPISIEYCSSAWNRVGSYVAFGPGLVATAIMGNPVSEYHPLLRWQSLRQQGFDLLLHPPDSGPKALLNPFAGPRFMVFLFLHV